MAIGIFSLSPKEAKADMSAPQWCLDIAESAPQCGYYWDSYLQCCVAQNPRCLGICN